MDSLPSPASIWQHTSGRRYTVLCVANMFTDRPEQYPVTIVYQGDNGRIWSRPAIDWARSMHPVSDGAEAKVGPMQVEVAARAMAAFVGWADWDTAQTVGQTQTGNEPDDERAYWRELALVALQAGSQAGEQP